uniref:Uncharacterized protein n=1 Tax=Cannabis sativa TaxID=3483 RepID=A0A803QH55_CANSA
MGEDFELPACGVEDGVDGEGSETDSVDNAPLDEPFSYEDLVSRVKKFELTTFERLSLIHIATLKPMSMQRPHLPFTNLVIIPTGGFDSYYLLRPARLVLARDHVEIDEVLSSLAVYDCDWRLLCTTTNLREHKLILADAKLQREAIYKEPSKK